MNFNPLKKKQQENQNPSWNRDQISSTTHPAGSGGRTLIIASALALPPADAITQVNLDLG